MLEGFNNEDVASKEYITWPCDVAPQFPCRPKKGITSRRAVRYHQFQDQISLYPICIK